jgi:hypothetical protein
MWLNKFAGAAVKALEAEFVHQKITMAAEKSEFVHFLLGNADNLSSKNRPFLCSPFMTIPTLNRRYVMLKSVTFSALLTCAACIFLQGLFQGRLVA